MSLGLSCLAAYLLGAIPFGILVTRLFAKTDVRAVGSGNIGATNVVRAAGRGAGALTLVLDAAKGGVAAYLGLKAFGLAGGACTGGAAFAGHVFPVYLRFRGGKGVATAVGTFVALAPLAALAGLLAYCLVFALSRISALGSLVGVAAVGGAIAFSGARSVILLYCAMATVIVWRHKANVQRFFEERAAVRADSRRAL